MASAASTSFCEIRVNSSRVPPVVGAGLFTRRTLLLYRGGTTRIVPASTFPSGPGTTAVTATSLDWQSRLGEAPPPDRIATGRNTSSSVVKAVPLAVLTTVPEGMR